MRQSFETRHREEADRGPRAGAGARGCLLLALLVLPGPLACKTPGAAAPTPGGEPDQTGQPEQPEQPEQTPDPDGPGEEIVAPDACAVGEPRLQGALPRLTSCLTAQFLTRATWQIFIALQWTADTSKGRGVALRPEDEKEFGRNGVPLVWETWKQDWELPEARATSSPWDSYAASRPPCDFIDRPGEKRVRVTPQSWPRIFEAGGRVLLDKINLVKDDREHDLSFTFTGPVIDARGEYVRYETRFNQALYDCGRDGSGPGCTAEPLSLPAFTADTDGAISVKAAWRRLASEDEKSTHHWRDLLVLNYETDRQGNPVAVCSPETHVLLGMHVVYKNSFVTTGPNQWVWATFEHQELASSCADVQEAWKEQGFSYEPAALARAPLPVRAQRTPVALCRLTRVPSITAQSNELYQPFLPAPWGNYRIVAMQWLLGGSPAPVRNVANVILEAYTQRDSCMGCHNEEAVKGDFLWTLALQHEDDLPVDEPAKIEDPEDLWR
jgi:hypothetical protein